MIAGHFGFAAAVKSRADLPILPGNIGVLILWLDFTAA